MAILPEKGSEQPQAGFSFIFRATTPVPISVCVFVPCYGHVRIRMHWAHNMRGFV